jgi:YHS domain-containing protein
MVETVPMMDNSQTGMDAAAVVTEVADNAVVSAVNAGNKICPVSGEKIDGSMGEVGIYEYKGKIYNLCCTMCLKDFSKDPEKYSKIADDEVMKAASAEAVK